MTSPCLERELRIPADIQRLKEARDWACEAAQAFGCNEDGCFQVKLAASEGVTNAIVHGSGSNGDPVEMEVQTVDDTLVFEIRDFGGKPEEGIRFDRESEGGRGLELVALLMDEMQLTRSDSGSVLRFVKRC